MRNRIDPAARAAFALGFRELLEPAVGVFAWGLVTGVAMMQWGLTLAQALWITLTTYAGAAQLAALPLISGGAPVWVVVLTGALVNLRFVIYALALRRHFRGASLLVRTSLGYLTGDIVFVKFSSYLERQPEAPHRLAYFAGGAIMNWIAWQSGSIAGIVGARAIPADSGLGLAGTLALLALIVPLCTRAPALAGVATAGGVAVAAHGLPLRLGLVLGVVCGVAAALLVEARGAPRDGRA